MTIKHPTTKIVGDQLHAVTDWNADHTGTSEPDNHGDSKHTESYAKTSGSVAFSGTVKGTGFIASDNSAGITKNVDFLDNAGFTNYVEIKNGLITRWDIL